MEKDCFGRLSFAGEKQSFEIFTKKYGRSFVEKAKKNICKINQN